MGAGPSGKGRGCNSRAHVLGDVGVGVGELVDVLDGLLVHPARGSVSGKLSKVEVAELWVQLGHNAEPVLRRPVLVTSLVVSLAGEWTLTCCREEEGRWAPASRSGGWSAPRQW